VGKLTFERPDTESFPCLGLAYEALRAGGTMPAVLNAANEAAVEGFLNGELGFNEIPDIIKKTMDAHDNTGATNIVGVLKAHQWAASHALGLLRAGAPSGGRA
jgi:1-deoxy-D-xylulose-5-phosphate reductoisomerase